MKASISPTNVFYTVMALFLFAGVVVIIFEKTLYRPPKYTFEYINHITTDSLNTILWAYWINTTETINRDSLPAELIDELLMHGGGCPYNNKMSFYYLDEEGTDCVAMVYCNSDDQQVDITLNP